MRIIMRTRFALELLMPKGYKPSAAMIRSVKQPRAVHNTGKQRLNVTVCGDLIKRARAANLNLSSIVEESLTEKLRKADMEQWLLENAEAIAHHKARIERDGMWNRDLIQI